MADVVLAAGRLVGDDAVGVGLSAGASRRRHGDQRTARYEVAAVIAKCQDLATIDGVKRDDLGRVDRRPASDRHHDRAGRPERDQRLAAAQDRCRVRIRLDRGMDADREAPSLEDRSYPVYDAGAEDARVADHEDAPTTELHDQVR